ncbi:MAG TPA: hypothetical protein VM535_00120, partial [Candidatus Saccharimonadales bacterium]|nr:hypothetical protein [Candidatus Saccharimonadales bacterium]
GGGDSPKKPKTPRTLASYSSTDAYVRMTIDGEINANQEHEVVRVTVNRQTATYEQLQGYEGTVLNTQNFANNEASYNNFLYALAHAGFTKGDPDKLLANERGQCPLGSRFIFELVDGGKTIQRYWATTCSSPKTYKGNLGATLELFERQIPNYDDLTEDLENL